MSERALISYYLTDATVLRQLDEWQFISFFFLFFAFKLVNYKYVLG